MKIQYENADRKIDSLGRVTLPKSMRARLYMEEGDSVKFYMIEEGETQFIGIAKGTGLDPRYLTAREVLKEMGLDVPMELQRKCGD